MKLLPSVMFVCLLAQSKGVPIIDNIFSDLFSYIGKGVSELLSLSSSSEEDASQFEKLTETDGTEMLNNMCSTLGGINPIAPDVKKMSFILHSQCNKLRFPLAQVKKILSNSNFDANKKLAIYVSGWTSSSDDSYILELADAFACRRDYNFLVLDSSYFISTLYSWSAYNTEEIGRQVALSLKQLIKTVKPDMIHLIGHSLGAHIVGYAGRYFTKYTGLKISRITGLDPANPCFNHPERGLHRDDAEFVDVIHTNVGVLGLKDPLGDVDFYPQGFNSIQPGCITVICSHNRANKYFTESVYPGNEYNFIGTFCESLKDLKKGSCNGVQHPMGLTAKHNIRGNYFLNVNNKMPFGRNNAGKNKAQQKCRKC